MCRGPGYALLLSLEFQSLEHEVSQVREEKVTSLAQLSYFEPSLKAD
jgi:hypothetical protein